MNVYLDHAATTPIDPQVISHISGLMEEVYGNPSSIHGPGRLARQKLEEARKTIAESIGAKPKEICFTSGGTEADNIALISAVRVHGVKNVLSSPIEHHAVLHALRHLENQNEINLHFAETDSKGHIDLDFLEDWLKKYPGSLVSLMHANNEIGTIEDLEKIGSLCHEHDAYFHTDTVQTIGYFDFNLAELPVDFLAGSAHKFYGPKGAGFLFHRSGCEIDPIFHGGGQEKQRRSGTENLHGICGMMKAIEVMDEQRTEFAPRMQKLKQYFIETLQSEIPEIEFNGDPKGESHYTVVNVTLPHFQGQPLFFAHLDRAGIAASGGSACSGGGKSHVIQHLRLDSDAVTVRFSIGRHTTEDEIDYTVHKVKEIIGAEELV